MSLPGIRLDVLLTGRAQPFSRPGSRSAIDKRPLRRRHAGPARAAVRAHRLVLPGAARGGGGAGEHLQLVERAHADWPLSRLSAVLFDKRVESELLRECLTLPLVPSWRRTLERRLEQGQVEDWAPRLQGRDAAE